MSRVESMTKFDVGKTALFVAAVRARERERTDPMFRDELSSLLAGPEGLAWLKASEADPSSNYQRGSFPYLEVRTRFFDDWAQQAVRESRATQLVLLGAGMDTRAFRLSWPDKFQFYEVDTPALFALKEARLQSAGASASCSRIVVEADLTSPDWVGQLLEKGFDKAQATIWLAEGLFQYLSAVDVNQVLGSAADLSTAGSRFGGEIISAGYLRSVANRPLLRRRKARGTPWRFGTNDPEALFRAHGWEVDRKAGPLEVAIALGRWSPAGKARPPRGRDGPPGASFVSAKRATERKAGDLTRMQRSERHGTASAVLLDQGRAKSRSVNRKASIPVWSSFRNATCCT
jgi:methyltransferase (TIGR00027 family)